MRKLEIDEYENKLIKLWQKVHMLLGGYVMDLPGVEGLAEMRG